MKNYVIASRTTASLTIISFGFVVYIHYCCLGTEADFWCNVLLAIFGSALLTLITSIIGYFTEKRNTLENFSYSTRSLLHVINKYDVNWELEKKIDFYLTYVDIDKSLWDSRLGAIYFMNDLRRKKFNYRYNNISKPLLDFNQTVCKHEFHFRWHKDGSGKNEVVMAKFVSELENMFIKRTINECLLGNEGPYKMTSIENQLVSNTLLELNGRYYKLMYHTRDKKGGKING